MADIERTTVDRNSSPVWMIVGLIVAVLLIAMFIWPGWVYAPFAGDTEGDTINIEQPDVNVEQPEQPDVNIEQPDLGTGAAPSDDTTP